LDIKLANFLFVKDPNYKEGSNGNGKGKGKAGSDSGAADNGEDDIFPGYKLKLIDFGSAQEIPRDRKARVRRIHGTIHTMAPEELTPAKGKDHYLVGLSSSRPKYSI
jgi:serine/threonine protein kinase